MLWFFIASNAECMGTKCFKSMIEIEAKVDYDLQCELIHAYAKEAYETALPYLIGSEFLCPQEPRNFLAALLEHLQFPKVFDIVPETIHKKYWAHFMKLINGTFDPIDPQRLESILPKKP